MASESRYQVKSLDKALSVLELMILKGEEMTLTDIATTLGMGKGTVHRVLGTLKARKFVHQDPESKKYGLGVRALEMGSSVKKEEILKKAMRPVLRELFLQCKETINAAVLEGGEIKYIYRLESEEPLRFSIQVGTRFPAYCTATGKILLSELSDQELYGLLGNRRRLRKLTENSIGSATQLMKELHDVRENELAYDLEETLIGVHCIAAPIWNAKKKIVAAISISGPRERMTRERLSEFLPKIKEASRKISTALGFEEELYASDKPLRTSALLPAEKSV